MKRLPLSRFAVFSLLCLLLNCSAPEEKIKMAINPWPGYGYFYLAEEIGLFEEEKLPLELVRFDSLADGQRAYIHGRVDALASTIVETVQASQWSGRPLSVLLVTDYSNGGDVIVAQKALPDVRALKGQRVGCEAGSLGIYVLKRALEKNRLTLEDVTVVNVEPGEAEAAFQSGQIDAYVSYPPYSVELMQQDHIEQIFSTAEIPFEVIDIVSVESAVLRKYPDFRRRLHSVWQRALDYEQKHPEEASEILARHLEISEQTLADIKQDLVILNAEDQVSVFSDDSGLKARLSDACLALKFISPSNTECVNLDKHVAVTR